MTIWEQILFTVKKQDCEAHVAPGLIRFGGTTWWRIVIVLPKSVPTSEALERVASRIEMCLVTSRERWGRHLVPGTVKFIAPSWHAIVMPDGFRRLKDLPSETKIVEVLVRNVSHMRMEAVGTKPTKDKKEK